MPVPSTYRTLFEIRCWHQRWLLDDGIPATIGKYYRADQFLEIVPTENCQRILQKYRWVFKARNFGGSVHAAVDSTQVLAPTFIKVEERMQLDFVLQYKDTLFQNYTNIPVRKRSDDGIYLSNIPGSTANSKLFLSQPLQPYDAGNTYAIGDVVRENNTIYELIDLPIQNPPTAAGQTNWAPGFDGQVVGSQDYIPFPGLGYRFEDINQVVPPGTTGTFSIQNRYNETVELGFQAIPVAEGDPPIPFEQFAYPAGSQSPFSHFMPLNNLPDGYYEVTPDLWQARSFFKLDTRKFPGFLGVVSIHHIPGTDSAAGLLDPSFRFLDDDSVPQEKQFHIYFKSRMTNWRYLDSNFDPPTVIHIETTPRPFLKAAAPIEIPIGANQVPVPNPAGERIVVEEVGNVERFFSNIYIKV
ncbi:MAG: hypothetical protein AAFP77_08340 [Bacteroidota bacterium]